MGILIAVGAVLGLVGFGGALVFTAHKIDTAVDGRDPKLGVGIRWKARDRERHMPRWLRALADVARILDAEGAAAGAWKAGQAIAAVRGSRIEVVDRPFVTGGVTAAGEQRGRTVVIALLGIGRISEGALAHEWQHLVLEALTGTPGGGGHSADFLAIVSRVNARLRELGL